MKIYLSGYLPIIKYNPEITLEFGLNAFPEMYKLEEKKIKEIMSRSKDRFLDSGGYSIRNNNLTLNVEDYVKYINKYGNNYSAIANMDTNDLKETLTNQRILEENTNHNILPVYHAEELFNKETKLLESYCEKYDYISLGGIAGKNMSREKLFIIFHKIFEVAKKRNTRIHGFGITSLPILQVFPFYSVDSTSWLSGVKFNQFRFIENSSIKTISAKESRQKMGIDLGKTTLKNKLSRQVETREKICHYITNLQKAKGLEYWNN